MNATTYHDTLIVGGGMAGLSAAVLLAKAGKKVAVYEASKHWGGRALSHHKEGFHFNLGPRALYRNGPAHNLMKSFGFKLEGKTPVLNHHGKALYKDNVYTLPTTPRAILSTKMITAGEKIQLAKAFIRLFRADTDALQNASFQSWLDDIPNPTIRDLTAMLGRLTTYCNDPINASAGATISQIKAGSTTSVLYLDGGWQQIIDALLQKAKALGVDLFLGEKVEEIIISESVHTIKTKENETTTHNLILATPPHTAAKLLPQSKQLQTAVSHLHPIQTACLTLALNHLPNPDCTIALGADQSFYYSLHSASAKVAPADNHLAYLITYLPPDHTSDPATDREFLETTFDRIQPGWRDHLVHAEFLPRITAAHGAVTAIPSRPAPRLPDCPNTTIIGDWVGKNHWLADASAHSAQQAVQSILA